MKHGLCLLIPVVFLFLGSIQNLSMGKGDKKSKKGKIWRDSYGKSRNRNKIKKRLKRLASTKRPAVAVGESKPKSSRRAPKKKD